MPRKPISRSAPVPEGKGTRDARGGRGKDNSGLAGAINSRHIIAERARELAGERHRLMRARIAPRIRRGQATISVR